MRARIPLLTSLLLLHPSAFSQPDLSVTGPVHTFGDVLSGSIVDHTFPLENRGDKPLRIHRIRTSCGCTVPDIETPLTIEPGQTVHLPVRLDLKGKEGNIRTNLTVFTNDPEKRITTLSLKGTSLQPVAAEPRTLNLGGVAKGSAAEGEIVLTSHTGDPFTILELKSLNDRVSLNVETAEDGRSARLHVTTKPVSGTGYFTDTLTLATDANPEAPLRMLVMWEVASESGIRISPPELKLSLQTPPRPVTRYHFIRGAAGGDPLDLDRAEWKGRDIPLQLEKHRLGGWRLVLTGIRPEQEMDGETILVHPSDPDAEPIKIPVRIMGGT